MILYKHNTTSGKKIRNRRTMDVTLEEYPVRPVPKYNTPKDKEKFIKTCESYCRKSLEYKSYIHFLKANLDMTNCVVLHNLSSSGDGNKYRIEIHHEPFTLFDITETVINKQLDAGMDLHPLRVADEVMNIHYDGIVGLIPLSTTMHELVHSGRIFIPLQYIYQSYDKFYSDYEPYISQNLIDKIEMKVNMSMKRDVISSDVLDVEFTYMNVDGFEFPTIPDEWKDTLMMPGID